MIGPDGPLGGMISALAGRSWFPAQARPGHGLGLVCGQSSPFDYHCIDSLSPSRPTRPARVLKSSFVERIRSELADYGDQLLWGHHGACPGPVPVEGSGLFGVWPGAEPPDQKPEAPSGAGKRGGLVLLIEDEEPTRAAMERVLQSAGYEVASAETVTAARELIEAENEYAAVLCDLTLADGSGAELVRWLREKRPALARRTLVLTGGIVDQAGRELEADGLTEVLRKPIAPSRLLERVAALNRPEAAPRTGPPPRAPAAPAPSPLKAPLEVDSPKSILVVEDDPAQRDAYARMLRAADFEVHTAQSGEEAIEILGQQAFDAVATDIGLPDLDGLEVLRAAQSRQPDLPVLLITGAPSVETATMAVQSRAVCYLSKPFEPQRLVKEIERAVQAGQVARLQRELLAAHAGADEFLQDLAGTEKAFAEALKQIKMVFQPIVRSHDFSVYAYEALYRSDAPSLNTPLRAILAAEVLGRMNEFGLATRRAVEKELRLRPCGSESIFVNIHPSELRGELLCASAEPLLDHAASVVLEVTERASLSAGPQVREEIRLLREAGYRIAIDDLGEGYAGLSWLVHLRPDIAKIDMSLVRDAHRSPLKRRIIASLASVCRQSGITTVAEGVESEDEALFLTDIGIDLLQGYFFAKPGPPFPEILQHSQPARGPA